MNFEVICRSVFGHLAAAIGFALVALVTFSAVPDAEAHNVTLLPASSGSLYVCGGCGPYVNLYDLVGGPIDKDWTIAQRISLSGGDNLQTFWFDFQVRDSDVLGFWVGEFGVPARDWGSGRTYGSTITTHVGGNMALQVWFYNVDVNGQQYDFYARAGYQ